MAVEAPTEVGPAVVALVLQTIEQVIAAHCPGRAQVSREERDGVTRVTVTPENKDAATMGFLLAPGEAWVHMGFGDVFAELPVGRPADAPPLADEIARIARAVVQGRYREHRWTAGGRVEEILGVIATDGGEEAFGRSGPLTYLHRLWSDPETRTYAPY